MKRKDVLSELLMTLFSRTTVKPGGGKIYCSGNLFSSCQFNRDAYDQYVKLLKIAFVDNNPQIQKPSYNPIRFDRINSLTRFEAYLRSYDVDITFASTGNSTSSPRAYDAALELLKAIFSPSTATKIFIIEKEDISKEFTSALHSIRKMQIGSNISSFLDSVDTIPQPCFIYDTSYTNDKTQYNRSLLINTTEDMFSDVPIIKEISLNIWIDENGKYDYKSESLYNSITSPFMCYNEEQGVTINNSGNNSEYFIKKPVSLVRIKNSFPNMFYFVTHLDQKTVFNKYQCSDESELINIITRRGRNQYFEGFKDILSQYELSLVEYTDDLIKRLLSIDLLWLYDNKQKQIEKCKEEVSKILIGYAHVFSLIDMCSEEVIIKQLIAILHHAVTETTKFIENNGRFIAECAVKHNCEGHINYVKNKSYGNKYKQHTALSEKLKQVPNTEPRTLYESYYYTSSNELDRLLNAISKYKNYFKKSKKSS
ncbi:hypothetical protein SAMN02910265_03214 [Ruminococcus flavefaciens]|uniref:Uncharacterized protein n=1 Tax=Ruminococcus flavefaciens TaxID=1265 RepID=A0A1H6LRK8_RUMFL|nr:hypothetical protein [Ruminococcus flavefaciens]SEH88997.1 hypothetical protein SAMN02910265_03214 [Ruminococcus flavefaciens]